MPERLDLLHYDYVPDIVERRTPHREAHLAMIARFKDAGRLVMAGAVGDPPHGALFVLTPGAAEALMDEDPYMAAQLVTGWHVEPWMVVT